MSGLLSMLDSPGAQLGLGLLAAAGPQPVPMSFGQRAAGAIGQFQQGQRAEREAKAQEAIRELQAQMVRAQMMEVQARTAERQQAGAERRRAAEERQRIDSVITGALSPVAPIEANAASGITGPRPEALSVVGQRRQIDPVALHAQGVPVDRIKEVMALPDLGRQEVARTVEVDDGKGNKMTVQLDRFGRRVGEGMPGYVPPVQVNQGDKITFARPQAGVSLPVGMSPEARDSSARGWAGVRQRQEEIQNRPERMVTVMDDQGNPVTLPQSQAQGMPAYSAAAATNIRKQAASQKARQQMSDTLQQLRDSYDALKAGGGIVNQEQNPIENVKARLGSTAVGQTLSGAVGGANQKEREKIEQTRPLLMNLIKEATGMSAQQMNSNVELQLYLRAATDPTLSYEANMTALDNLNKLFGLGATGGRASEARGSQSGGLTPAEQQELQQLRQRFNRGQ